METLSWLFRKLRNSGRECRRHDAAVIAMAFTGRTPIAVVGHNDPMECTAVRAVRHRLW